MKLMSLHTILISSILVLVTLTMEPSQSRADPYDIAVLQGLDKVTARVSTIEVPIGDSVRFGALDIIVHHCDKRPPEETPESAAFIDLAEIRPGEPAKNLFRGWMFSSSPAVSALEHPVYDIWVLNCKNPEADSQ